MPDPSRARNHAILSRDLLAEPGERFRVSEGLTLSALSPGDRQRQREVTGAVELIHPSFNAKRLTRNKVARLQAKHNTNN